MDINILNNKGHILFSHCNLMINSFNLLKESKNLSTIRDVLFEEINLCQYILVHWKRNALVIYNMNIIKNVLVRVVHMLQDINTLMQPGCSG